jgi:hypothetical protein
LCATKKLFRKGRTVGLAFLVQFKDIFKKVRSEGETKNIKRYRRKKNKEIY